MTRIAATTLMMARAGGAAGLVAAVCWPAMLAGLWTGLALACAAPALRRRTG
jgi:uncharacterized membrane protein (UPF0136 family)